MNHETREFIVVVAAALLILDVIYEVVKMWIRHKERR